LESVHDLYFLMYTIKGNLITPLNWDEPPVSVTVYAVGTEQVVKEF